MPALLLLAAAIERLAEAVRCSPTLWAYMERGLFTPRSRSRFLSGFPEGAIGACAA